MKFNSHEVFTVPNAVSAARLIATPFVAKKVAENPSKGWLPAAAFALTDKVDGVLARLEDKSPALARLGFRRSEVGRKGDPVIDKIFSMFMVGAGLKSGAIPRSIGVASLAQKTLVSLNTLRAEANGINLQVSRTGQVAEFISATGLTGLIAAEAIEKPALKQIAKVAAGAAAIVGVCLATEAMLDYREDFNQQLTARQSGPLAQQFVN